MNKSPEAQRNRRLDGSISSEVTARELDFETRIHSDEHLTAGSELAADRELSQQLAAIQAPALPTGLRQQVLDHSNHQRIPMGWMALAAAVVMSLLVALALENDESTSTVVSHQLTASDWAQLHVALTTLDAIGRRVAQVTEREVRPHLKRPEIQITSLPDSETVWSWFRSSLNPTR